MENKKKILVVIRHPVGGIRTYLKYVYKYLNPQLYHITVIMVRDDEGTMLKNQLSQFEHEIIEVSNNSPNFHLFLSILNSAFGRPSPHDFIHRSPAGRQNPAV